MLESAVKKLNLQKNEKLEVEFADGKVCTYTITYLRSMCPCAMCKVVREQRDPHQLLQAEQPKKQMSLTILPGNYSGALVVSGAELVGNYAVKITFSDGHDTGIYSFSYLREICQR
jgi:DUF971 family protein